MKTCREVKQNEDHNGNGGPYRRPLPAEAVGGGGRADGGELEQILSYMDVLDGLDTSGAEPMSHIVPLKNVLREDETAPSMDRGELLKNAPATDGGTFLVPKAVE